MASTMSSPTTSQPPSKKSSRSSLTLDLSSIPPLSQPTPPSNTLLITNLQDLDIFRADNLQTIRDLINGAAPIHSWAPLKSFRRIQVSFWDEDAAIRIRQILDGEAIMGQRTRVYFGKATPVEVKDEHLSLPDKGKLFFISPPPSPPQGWEMRMEDAPNKMVHAEDLAEALARLHHRSGPDSPTSPASDAEGEARRPQRSRSSTLIYQPAEDGNSPNLPAIAVEDFTEEPESGLSPYDMYRPILANTSRPPVELMNDV